MEKLTPEQVSKLNKLMLRHTVSSFLIGVKFGLYFGACVLITGLLNVYYVKSEDFAFVMGIVNAIFLLHFFLANVKRSREALRANVEKIIKPQA